MKFKKDGNVLTTIAGAFTIFCSGKNCFHETDECPLYQVTEDADMECMDWAVAHPAEAARLMGYEVVEEEVEKSCDNCGDRERKENCKRCTQTFDSVTKTTTPPTHWKPEEAKMEKQKHPNAIQHNSNTDSVLGNTKPRICEVLGVEVGERFKIDYPFCNETGVYSVEEKDGEYRVENKKTYTLMGNRKVFYVINNPECITRLLRSTEEEVRMAAHLFDFRGRKDALIGRQVNGPLWWRDTEGGDGHGLLPREFFPSILPGQSVRLSEIVKVTKYGGYISLRDEWLEPPPEQ